MFQANAKLPIGLGAWIQHVGYILQELTKLRLSIYTVVIEQGRLQYASVYKTKFKVEWTKTGYLMTFQLTKDASRSQVLQYESYCKCSVEFIYIHFKMLLQFSYLSQNISR